MHYALMYVDRWLLSPNATSQHAFITELRTTIIQFYRKKYLVHPDIGISYMYKIFITSKNLKLFKILLGTY